MHPAHFALALLATIDWSYVIHQSPARIVAIAVAVYAFLQGVKQFFPLLTGWWAVAANVILSGAGVLAVTPADQLFTPANLAVFVSTVLTAAGIHGTVSKVALPSSTAAKSILIFVGLGLVAMTVTGCTNFERTTFNSLATSKGVIDQAQADYTSGTIKQTQCTYAVINNAKAAQTVAVDAMLIYESDKAAGKDLTSQTTIISADIAAIVPIVAQLKTLYTNPAACVTPTKWSTPWTRPQFRTM